MTQKNIIIAIILIAAVAVGAYVYTTKKPGENADTQPNATVSGNVTYMQRVALPTGSVVEVELRDTSRADAPAEILAKNKITTTGQNVPIPYTLNYDPTKIVENNSYSVAAKITIDGKLSWISTVNIPVITRGNPTNNVEILVSQANTETTPPSSGQTNAPLVGTEWAWVRTTYPNKAALTAPTGNKFVMTLKADKTISSSTDCNGLGGNYVVNGEVLSFSEFISTLRYCEDSPETQYSQDLRQTSSYVISGNELRLNLTKDAGTMYFQKR